jgi:hypothetical protein
MQKGELFTLQPPSMTGADAAASATQNGFVTLLTVHISITI